MATRVTFNSRVITEKLKGDIAERVYRRLGAQVLGSLVLNTPVGLPGSWQSPPPPSYTPGHARFSWSAGINKGETEDKPGTDPGGAATIARGESKLRSVKLKDRIVISNTAPYINRLNEGWSRQAGAGYVEKAIEAGIRTVQGRFKL